MPLVYGLHPEILSLIFEYAKYTKDEIPLAYKATDRVNGSIPFEVTVCGVCSYFREAALATSSLWTDIHVRENTHPGYIIHRLSHTGNCSLDIRIDLVSNDPPMGAIRLESIIDHLLLRSLQWRSMCIGYGCERPEHPVVIQLCSAPAPGLQKLSLAVANVVEADRTLVNRSVNLPHIFRGSASKLEFIRLRGLAIQLFRPPLSYVKTLHLDQTRDLPIRYSTLKDILTASPFLANISLYGDIIARGNWPDHQKTVSLPALQSLRLHSISGEAFAGVLKIIDAPDLASLTLKGVHEGDLDPVWIMTDKGKFGELKSLSLVDCEIGATQRGWQARILHALSIESIEGSDEVRSVPWPKLETIRLGPELYESSQAARNALMTARKEHGCPIPTLIFRINTADMKNSLPPKAEAANDFEIKFDTRDDIWPEDSGCVDPDDIFFR